MPCLNIYAVTASGEQVCLNVAAEGAIGKGVIPEGIIYRNVIAHENITFCTVQNGERVHHQLCTADGTIIATIHDSLFTGYGFTMHGSFRAFRGDKIIDIATEPGAPLKTVATLEGVTCADSSSNSFLWAANDAGDIAFWKDSVLIQRVPTGSFKPRCIIMTSDGFRAMMVATSNDGKIHFLKLCLQEASITVEDARPETEALYWCDDISSVRKGIGCMFLVVAKKDGTRMYHACYAKGVQFISHSGPMPIVSHPLTGKTIVVDLKKVQFQALTVHQSNDFIEVPYACMGGLIYGILSIHKVVSDLPPKQASYLHMPGGSHNIHGFISDDPVPPMPACGVEPDIMFSDRFVQQDREELQKKVEELERKLTILAQLRRAAVKGETGSSYTDGRIKELERQLEARGKVLRETANKQALMAAELEKAGPEKLKKANETIEKLKKNATVRKNHDDELIARMRSKAAATQKKYEDTIARAHNDLKKSQDELRKEKDKNQQLRARAKEDELALKSMRETNAQLEKRARKEKQAAEKASNKATRRAATEKSEILKLVETLKKELAVEKEANVTLKKELAVEKEARGEADKRMQTYKNEAGRELQEMRSKFACQQHHMNAVNMEMDNIANANSILSHQIAWWQTTLSNQMLPDGLSLEAAWVQLPNISALREEARRMRAEIVRRDEEIARLATMEDKTTVGVKTTGGLVNLSSE
jgi:hypothetical protein